jgi:hypothetical protein
MAKSLNYSFLILKIKGFDSYAPLIGRTIHGLLVETLIRQMVSLKPRLVVNRY